MRYSFFKTVIISFIVIIVVIFVDLKIFEGGLARFGPSVIKKPASYVFVKLENAGFFLRSFAKARVLIAENENLKKENNGFISKLADYEDTKKENDFLRKALNISPRFNNEIIYANIYYSQLNPDGYDILLAKGTEEGVYDNDIIITEDGILVGMIEKSYGNFARVLIISDPDFSVMARVLNSNTVGIATGNLNKGLSFDLITQSDSIKEGDMVVSSGMDSFPPALIVGIVSHVETKETDLFKKVRIRPTVEDVKIGRVLIIKSK